MPSPWLRYATNIKLCTCHAFRLCGRAELQKNADAKPVDPKLCLKIASHSDRWPLFTLLLAPIVKLQLVDQAF